MAPSATDLDPPAVSEPNVSRLNTLMCFIFQELLTHSSSTEVPDEAPASERTDPDPTKAPDVLDEEKDEEQSAVEVQHFINSTKKLIFVPSQRPQNNFFFLFLKAV